MKYMISLIILMISSVTYAQNNSDSLKTKKIDSLKTKELKEVKIESRSTGNSVDDMQALRIERMNHVELRKNACCNLAESFESSPTVEVSFNNAVTGARSIQMLGLSGIYVQMLTDVLPTVRGLNYTYGFSNIPSTQVSNIFINKGPGSVTNGFESMTGQIDIELLKPEISPALFVNGYLNTQGRSELNLNLSKEINSKWSTMLMTHGSFLSNKMDRNHDGFMDIPLYQQMNAIHRWKYRGKHWEDMFGVKGLYDEKNGGQLAFNSSSDLLSQPYWGFQMKTKRLELFHKGSYNFDGDGNKSLGLQSNLTLHDMNGYYGRRPYQGKQNTLYLNLIYQTYLNCEAKEFRMGASLLYDHIQEKFDQYDLQRKEPVAGIFGEYTYRGSEKWSLLLGSRGDYNFRLKKAYFIPRANFKYSLTSNISLRLSAGSGFRTSNVFAENPSLFVSNRTPVIHGSLLPEYSWNYGANLSYTYKQNRKEGRLSFDLFRTDFSNQVVADFDWDHESVHFYNLNGKSYAWYFQAEWYYEWIKNLDVRIAYKFNDARVTQQGVLREKLWNARNRALVNIAYTTRNKHWKADMTLQYTGKQRLAYYSQIPTEYRMPEFSPTFFRLLGQLTYVHRSWEIYSGCENMNNYVQKQLVVDPEHPFGNFFDAGNVWGPTMGRVVYVGFRWTKKYW